MLKKSKSLSEIKKELKEYLNNEKVLDVLIFGSYIKGKTSPSDVDIAIITEEKLKENPGYHISFIEPKEFFEKIPSIVNTLLKEGYSLKSNRFLSENYGFKNKTLFNYNLSGIPESNKVKIVNFLRGNKKSRGIVEQNKGEWLSKGVFTSDIDKDYLFENYLLENKIKFKKYHLLIH